MIVTVACVVGFTVTATGGVNAFFYPGTFGTILLLIAYIMTEVGAINHFFVRRRVFVARWEVVIPAAGTLILAYTLYRNVWPLPSPPFNVITILHWSGSR